MGDGFAAEIARLSFFLLFLLCVLLVLRWRRRWLVVDVCTMGPS